MRSRPVLSAFLVALGVLTVIAAVTFATQAEAVTRPDVIQPTEVLANPHDPVLDQVRVAAFGATPAAVPLGATSRLYWKLGAPNNVTFTLDGYPVIYAGSLQTPPVYGQQHHVLVAHHGNNTRVLGTVTVSVQPCPIAHCGLADTSALAGAAAVAP